MDINDLLNKINAVMNKYGKAIYNHTKQNIPELDDLYYQLFTYLIINNELEFNRYYGYFFDSFSIQLKIRINEFLLEHNCSIKYFNLFDLRENYELDDSLNNKIKEIYQKMLSKSESGNFDIDNYGSRYFIYQKIDPLYMLKNKDNVKNIMDKYDWLLYDLEKVLNYLIQENYQFSMQDKKLIDYITKSSNFFEMFLNCYFDKEVFDILFNELLHKIIEEHTGYNLMKILVERYPNYINDLEINLDIENNYEDFLQIISVLNHKKIRYKIKTPAIDAPFLKKIKEILGENVLVSPQRNAVWGNINYYSIDELLEIDSKIDVLAKSLADHDGKTLSPLEKFIAAYIIVTNFAIYKVEKDDPSKSRSLYEIMRTGNDNAIVCVGYVNLLNELLTRNGMGEFIIDHSVRAKGESDYDLKDSNHARAIYYLKDEKYHKEGVYMTDPTWDSIKKGEIPGRKKVDHMLLTYDEALKDKESFPRGIDDLYLTDNDLEKMSKELGINVPPLFHNPIDEDTIINCLCAINRFVSKNSYDVSDSKDVLANGYTYDEYNRVVLQLERYDKFIFTDKMVQMPFNELKSYLIDEYNINDSDMNVLLAMYINDCLKTNVSLKINNTVELIYNYIFINSDGSLKYSEEDIERIYSSLGYNISSFPYLDYKMAEFDLSNSLNTIVTSIKKNNIDYDSIIENEFNSIISRENAVK